MKNKKRRVLPLAIALVAIVALSGVAYAYWSSSGNANGSAGVGTSQLLTVSQSGSVTGLVPGGPAQDVTVHVVNPATFSQSLSAVAITVTSLPAGCDVLWFPVTNPTIGAPIVLTATGTAGDSTNVVGQIRMIESGTNQDLCKNASLTLHFVVS